MEKISAPLRLCGDTTLRESDLLAQILALNESVAAAIANGDPVTAPGVPEGYPEPEGLVTEDCIRAQRRDMAR
ncbi:MAG: hypothetical protein GXX91_17560, partial [Verrucomicrobiaceae bacterium]|nr:hypothetical protein [Verrucomicrobiaceae bacterium]